MTAMYVLPRGLIRRAEEHAEDEDVPLYFNNPFFAPQYPRPRNPHSLLFLRCIKATLKSFVGKVS